MKLIPSLLFILLISSCGKKSEGSNPGMSPLLPAPVSETTTIPTTPITPTTANTDLDKLDTEAVMISMLAEVGIRIEASSSLVNNPAVIICVNTEFTHEEKIEALKNYFVTINDEQVTTTMPKTLLNSLIAKAVETLSAGPLDARKCPKIYLAIE